MENENFSLMSSEHPFEISKMAAADKDLVDVGAGPKLSNGHSFAENLLAAADSSRLDSSSDTGEELPESRSPGRSSSSASSPDRRSPTSELYRPSDQAEGWPVGGSIGLGEGRKEGDSGFISPEGAAARLTATKDQENIHSQFQGRLELLDSSLDSEDDQNRKSSLESQEDLNSKPYDRLSADDSSNHNSLEINDQFESNKTDNTNFIGTNDAQNGFANSPDLKEQDLLTIEDNQNVDEKNENQQQKVDDNLKDFAEEECKENREDHFNAVNDIPMVSESVSAAVDVEANKNMIDSSLDDRNIVEQENIVDKAPILEIGGPRIDLDVDIHQDTDIAISEPTEDFAEKTELKDQTLLTPNQEHLERSDSVSPISESAHTVEGKLEIQLSKNEDDLIDANENTDDGYTYKAREVDDDNDYVKMSDENNQLLSGEYEYKAMDDGCSLQPNNEEEDANSDDSSSSSDHEETAEVAEVVGTLSFSVSEDTPATATITTTGALTDSEVSGQQFDTRANVEEQSDDIAAVCQSEVDQKDKTGSDVDHPLNEVIPKNESDFNEETLVVNDDHNKSRRSSSSSSSSSDSGLDRPGSPVDLPVVECIDECKDAAVKEEVDQDTLEKVGVENVESILDAVYQEMDKSEVLEVNNAQQPEASEDVTDFAFEAKTDMDDFKADVDMVSDKFNQLSSDCKEDFIKEESSTTELDSHCKTEDAKADETVEEEDTTQESSAEQLQQIDNTENKQENNLTEVEVNISENTAESVVELIKEVQNESFGNFSDENMVVNDMKDAREIAKDDIEDEDCRDAPRRTESLSSVSSKEDINEEDREVKEDVDDCLGKRECEENNERDMEESGEMNSDIQFNAASSGPVAESSQEIIEPKVDQDSITDTDHAIVDQGLTEEVEMVNSREVEENCNVNKDTVESENIHNEAGNGNLSWENTTEAPIGEIVDPISPKLRQNEFPCPDMETGLDESDQIQISSRATAEIGISNMENECIQSKEEEEEVLQEQIPKSDSPMENENTDQVEHVEEQFESMIIHESEAIQEKTVSMTEQEQEDVLDIKMRTEDVEIEVKTNAVETQEEPFEPEEVVEKTLNFSEAIVSKATEVEEVETAEFIEEMKTNIEELKSNIDESKLNNEQKEIPEQKDNIAEQEESMKITTNATEPEIYAEEKLEEQKDKEVVHPETIEVSEIQKSENLDTTDKSPQAEDVTAESITAMVNKAMGSMSPSKEELIDHDSLANEKEVPVPAIADEVSASKMLDSSKTSDDKKKTTTKTTKTVAGKTSTAPATKSLASKTPQTKPSSTSKTAPGTKSAAPLTKRNVPAGRTGAAASKTATSSSSTATPGRTASTAAARKPLSTATTKPTNTRTSTATTARTITKTTTASAARATEGRASSASRLSSTRTPVNSRTAAARTAATPRSAPAKPTSTTAKPATPRVPLAARVTTKPTPPKSTTPAATPKPRTRPASATRPSPSTTASRTNSGVTSRPTSRPTTTPKPSPRPASAKPSPRPTTKQTKPSPRPAPTQTKPRTPLSIRSTPPARTPTSSTPRTASRTPTSRPTAAKKTPVTKSGSTAPKPIQRPGSLKKTESETSKKKESVQEAVELVNGDCEEAKVNGMAASDPDADHAQVNGVATVDENDVATMNGHAEPTEINGYHEPSEIPNGTV